MDGRLWTLEGARGCVGGRVWAEAHADSVRVANDADGAQAAVDEADSRGWGAAGGDGSTAMEDGNRDRRPEEERGRHLDRWSSQIRNGRRPC